MVKIFIGGLPPHTTRAQLLESIFSKTALPKNFHPQIKCTIKRGFGFLYLPHPLYKTHGPA
jgi:hypothetical protein